MLLQPLTGQLIAFKKIILLPHARFIFIFITSLKVTNENLYNWIFLHILFASIV